ARIDRRGLVPDELHRDGARHTGPLQVPDGRTAKVVRDAAHEPGGLTRLPPGLPDVTDLRAVLPMEHVRDDRPEPLLDPARVLTLALQARGQFGQHPEGEDAGLAILRLAGVEPDLAGLEIHLPPLEGQDL